VTCLNPKGVGRVAPDAYASRVAKAPKPIRQQLAEYEDGAHLFAPFVVQWRAGVATLIPFGILFFTTQPFGQAATTLTMGGYIIGPAVIAFFSTAWALLSTWLLHVLRFDTRTWVHYATYALAGAVALFVTAMASLVVVRLIEDRAWDFWNAQAFTGFLWAAPLLGAISSVIGRRTLAPGIRWYRWLERPPLPDVFEFVEGKRDKDEFQRM